FDHDQAGIVLQRVEGVTVTNGTVTKFDAGVAIMGGSKNTVRGITARDNVNYRILTGRDAFPEDIDPETGPFCWFGDGITAFNSPDNLITGNVTTGNGPFSGISLVGNSDNNMVANNQVVDNDVLNQTPDGRPNTICGGLVPGTPDLTGRRVQDVGIRVEGPNADRNVVAGNQVVRSGLAGIVVHAVPVTTFNFPNGYNTIRNNQIFETGKVGVGIERHLHGIMLHHSGSPLVLGPHHTLVENNQSSRNFGGGIMVDSRGPGIYGTVVRNNQVNDNGLDGVHVAGPGDPRGTRNLLVGNYGSGNGARAPEVNAQFPPEANYAGTDGADMSRGCIRNKWLLNRFRTVNQRCVAEEGTGRVVPSAGHLVTEWFPPAAAVSAASTGGSEIGAFGRGPGRLEGVTEPAWPELRNN
ncbi:MAG: right-handed parallel beta-helix repeat-containing protein, partial [Actinobacteria bacterium]|nr:right-handed parallel beta-helix repeat-containing protein [Actinomycetota bacterium]